MTIILQPAALRDLELPCARLAAGLGLGYGDPQAGLAALREVLSALAAGNRPSPWGNYWACCEERDALVGLCGFKSEPGPAGVVEIASYTMPRCEGSGIATGMARALIGIAAKAGASLVLAHTLPVANASGALLSRLGFANVGIVVDPEDGPVWRWVLPLASAGECPTREPGQEPSLRPGAREHEQGEGEPQAVIAERPKREQQQQVEQAGRGHAQHQPTGPGGADENPVEDI
jgi:RimJ/RimL family protein N-acetyltransferase